MLTPDLEWKTSGVALALTRSSVHVWFAHLDHPDAAARQLWGDLSPDECLRAMRFQFERDRNRYVVARSILRQILAIYVAGEPLDLLFKYGPWGKPALGGSFAKTELRFNVSHSAAWAMFAVARKREIGVDLECVRPLSDMLGLAESCFTTVENAALARIPEHERRRAFFDGWTRKEAFLKAIGKGLSFPLKAFSVSVAPGSGWRELTIHEERGVGPEWTLMSVVPPGAELSAALVIEGRDACVTTSIWPIRRIPSGNTHSTNDRNARRDTWSVPKFGT